MERLHNTDPVANWAKILNPDPNSIYLDPQHQCCGAGPFLTGSGSGSDQKVPAPNGSGSATLHNTAFGDPFSTE